MRSRNTFRTYILGGSTVILYRVKDWGVMTDVIDQRVLKRYDICQKVGQGAYGVVWKAVHRKKGHIVALKKCFDAFRCDVDAQRTYREVMYLKALSSFGGGGGDDDDVGSHPNIIKLHNVIRGTDNDRDLYITFEYLDTDLSQVIKARILEPMVSTIPFT